MVAACADRPASATRRHLLAQLGAVVLGRGRGSQPDGIGRWHVGIGARLGGRGAAPEICCEPRVPGASARRAPDPRGRCRRSAAPSCRVEGPRDGLGHGGITCGLYPGHGDDLGRRQQPAMPFADDFLLFLPQIQRQMVIKCYVCHSILHLVARQVRAQRGDARAHGQPSRPDHRPPRARRRRSSARRSSPAPRSPAGAGRPWTCPDRPSPAPRRQAGRSAARACTTAACKLLVRGRVVLLADQQDVGGQQRLQPAVHGGGVGRFGGSVRAGGSTGPGVSGAQAAQAHSRAHSSPCVTAVRQFIAPY